MSKSRQTETGKAFEYACALELSRKYKKTTDVVMEDSQQMTTARGFFDSLTPEERNDYVLGADAAVKIIDRLEPRLSDSTSGLVISLQPDRAGESGDVRDVLCMKADGWEIGLSCKHNHHAVKHSRLSDRIDFGKEWFGSPCSGQYFSDINKVFAPLRKLRDESKANGTPAGWDSIPDKEGTCYVPALEAFMTELRRLDEASGPDGSIPEKLIRYLVGTHDFYKVIMNSQRRITTVEAVNISGTLNRKNGKKRALVDTPLMKMPTEFYKIGFKEGSRNTIIVVCDNGWNVSMRIHNASSRVEPSLKFDVQLLAMPSSILTQIEPWEEQE